ncbi:hypothetical protein PMIN02_003508 [Paraphaeosphaeria minitans]
MRIDVVFWPRSHAHGSPTSLLMNRVSPGPSLPTDMPAPPHLPSTHRRAAVPRVASLLLPLLLLSSPLLASPRLSSPPFSSSLFSPPSADPPLLLCRPARGSSRHVPKL